MHACSAHTFMQTKCSVLPGSGGSHVYSQYLGGKCRWISVSQGQPHLQELFPWETPKLQRNLVQKPLPPARKDWFWQTDKRNEMGSWNWNQWTFGHHLLYYWDVATFRTKMLELIWRLSRSNHVVHQYRKILRIEVEIIKIRQTDT